MTVSRLSCRLLILYVYLGQEGMELDGTHVNKHMNKHRVISEQDGYETVKELKRKQDKL